MNAITLANVAEKLGGEVHGGSVLAPGPKHSEADRSLKVTINAGAPGGFVVHSYAGDDWQDCKNYVCEKMDRPTFAEEVAERQAAAKKRESTPEERKAFALEIWHAARSPVGTLAATYLASRGLHLPDDVLAGDSIRFHPHCPFGKKTRRPCLMALFTDAETGELRGIHRLGLTATGEKIDRMALGPIGGCVIRLWPDEAVERGLALGEGIETTLAAATRVQHRGTLLQPAWAAGFAGNMKSFPVLPGIEALTILVDNDASSHAGQKAAAECAARWTAAGREAVRLTPRLPGDFNDIVVDVRR